MKKNEFRIIKEISYRKGKRNEGYVIQNICWNEYMALFLTIPFTIIFGLILIFIAPLLGIIREDVVACSFFIAIILACILSSIVSIDKGWELSTEDRFKTKEDAIKAIGQIKNNTYDNNTYYKTE